MNELELLLDEADKLSSAYGFTSLKQQGEEYARSFEIANMLANLTTAIEKLQRKNKELTEKQITDEILNAARSEGWVYRDEEQGTYYEIGWDQTNDDGNDEWFVDHKTTSLSRASQTAYRWGCEYRAVRTNPFLKKEN